ncbi:MAG TPA: SdrD B-like domain-containing protein, partial [Chloroflexota bacterium]|nr:SdrD B-like domain-containing protein [Chloroflexota bacterium]
RDARVTVEMAGGTVDRLTKLWYEKQCTTEIKPPAGESYLGCPFDLRAVDAADERVNLSRFGKSLQIAVRYTDEEARGLTPSSFHLAYYDGTSWVPLPSRVDPEGKLVTAPTDHFTLFSLLGSSAPMVPMQSEISGRVYYDRNGNGVFDDEDFPIAKAGVKIESGDWYAFTTTEWDGRYAFPCLRESKYTVSLEVGPEWAFTTPNRVVDIPVTGRVDSTQTGVDFGMWYRVP